MTATQRMAILASPPQDENPYNDGYFGEGGKGEGTAENPFRIYNIEQLQAIDGVVPAEVAADLSSVEIAQALTLFGASAEGRLSSHYVLANDIDATATRGWNGGKGFDPINDFRGVFDGSEREVRGLWIDRPGEDRLGLFGNAFGAAIVSLGVTDAYISGGSQKGGGSQIGGLVGELTDGSISSSWLSGAVSGDESVGGLVGELTGGTISSSGLLGAVSGVEFVGGLVGDAYHGTILSSWSSGTVSGEHYIGGLVGKFYGTISSSRSSGAVSGNASVGGLAGYMYGGTISSSGSSGAVSGGFAVGGLVGDFNGTVLSSWSSGVVSGGGAIGGLIGLMDDGTISLSWSSGAVLGESVVGGLVGDFEHGTISSSWSSSAVSGERDVGGLVGYGVVGYIYGTISSSWSSGAVSGERDVGGVVGHIGKYDDASAIGGYWSVETSGARYSRGGIGVDTLQTISVAAWSADIWRFGGDRDFPVLISHDADRQAAEIASGLTRILNVYGRGLAALDARATTDIYALIEEGATSGFAVLQLDTNGLAPNEGETGETSKPICDLSDGVLSADAGYNGVTVRVQSENAALSELQSGCRFALHSLSVSDEVALSVDIVAGAITMSRVYNLSVAGGVRHSAPAVVNSGSTIFITADAAARSAAATVIAVAADERVSATFVYAAQSPYFTVSERGEGTVRLSDSALDIFGNEDNKELTLVVTVSNERAPTLLATATFYFRSAPRAIDGGALTVAIGDFRQGATILASRLVEAKVLHAEESYSLDDGYGLFAANIDNGEIVLTADIVAAGEWTVVLRATSADEIGDGYAENGGFGVAAARRAIRITMVTSAKAAKGRERRRIRFGYTTSSSCRRLKGLCRQRVAADLSSVEIAQALTLFGANAEERLSSHYILANDIDATATRGWNDGEGFDPIGHYYDYYNDSLVFFGVFDGDGREVRGLWIDRPDEHNIGFFGKVYDGAIVSLGVVDAYIRGDNQVGGLVGEVRRARISSSSFSGVVSGNDFVGGLVGYVYSGSISSSWSSGAVSGADYCVGGLVGEFRGDISSSWSSSAVSGRIFVGGLVGFELIDGIISSSWSSGAVSGDDDVGGLVGYKNDSTRVSYWSVETSGAKYSRGGIGVDTLQTISVAAWSADVWRFGGDRDFPVLVSLDADRQAAGIANGLTRVLNAYGGGLAALDARATTEIYALIEEEDATSGFAVLQLDTNGLAANEGEAGETSKPECSLRDGVLSAGVGYNGVTVKVRSENAALSDLQSGCKFELHSLPVSGEAALSVDIVAGAITLRRVYNLSVAGGVRHDAPVIVNSGTTIFIAANAAARSAAAAVIAVAADERVSAAFAYAAQSPYFTVSERGEGTVRLSDSAINIFGDEDNKELTLVVTVSDGQAGPLFTTATLFFRSQPRAIDGGVLTVTIENFQQGATILLSRLVKAKVLHAKESYSLDDGYGLFAANIDNGEIVLATNIVERGEWTVVLRATSADESVTAAQRIVFKAMEESFVFEIAEAGSTILIDANAASGSAVATIMVDGAERNGVSVLYSAQSSNFTVSERGVALLSDSALDIFGDEDGKELTLIVTAQSGTQPMFATAAIYFRSQPRAIDGGALTMTIGDFRRGAIVLPSRLVKAKVLHTEESHSLVEHHGLFAANYDGAILLTAGIFVSGEWTVVLQAASESGLIAARQTIVFRTPPPLGGDNPFDDGHENGKGEGTPENPFRIYNIEQLQAIEGVVAPEMGLSLEEAWKGITLFGASDEERLSRHYILGNDIDATATRGWNDGKGFYPIGRYAGRRNHGEFLDRQRRFRGVFNGDGHVVRGLWIDRRNKSDIGLFGRSSGAIVSLGVTDAYISGYRYVGGLVGELRGGTISSSGLLGVVSGVESVGGLVGDAYPGAISSSWSSGTVSGRWGDIGGLVGKFDGTISSSWSSGAVSGDEDVGGLVGYMYGGTISSSGSSGAVSGDESVGGLVGNFNGAILSSWSSGAVSGDRFVGGLVGLFDDWAISSLNWSSVGKFGRRTISSSWSSGAVSGDESVGGLVGLIADRRTISSSWSSSAVLGDDTVGGLVGNAYYGDSAIGSYWSVETSGARYSDGGIGVDTLQTISVAAWDAGVWRFGGDRDFPILVSFDADRQAAEIANGLTRILGVFGDDLATLDARAPTAIDDSIPAFAVLQLDTNGLAPNEGGGETSKPVCDLRDGVLTADAGYNGVTVKARAANAVLSELKLNCEFVARPLSIPSEAALSVEIVGDSVTLRRVYNLSVSGLLSVWENDGAPTVSSGATIWIEAGAAAGSSVATIAAGDSGARQDGAILTYAAQSPYFAISEQDAGTVRLSDSAAVIFDEENEEAALVVTVSDGQIEPMFATATIFFRSRPRAIDGDALIVTIGDFRQGATVLASRLVEAKVLHAEESYSLDDDYGLFAANIDNGEIVLAANIVEAGEWTVVLRATSADESVTATQRVAILASPPRGDNPYNEGYFDEGGKGEGTPENPFRIYNIEQLQAIDGVVPREVAVDLSSAEFAQALVLFGASKEERRSRHYVLANDIDATVTRGWNGGEGFDPIGNSYDSFYEVDPYGQFSGIFDGGGREVRGLWIDRPRENHIGLFARANGAIMSLGVTDAYIRGNRSVGSLVGGVAHGTISSSWSSGAVSGDSNVAGLVGSSIDSGIISSSWSSATASGDTIVGGLAGYVVGGDISSSWSSGAVSGIRHVGGLVGQLYGGSISSGWSFGAVSGRFFVGGLVGYGLNGGDISSSWSSGAVSGVDYVGGLVGHVAGKRFDYAGGGTIASSWSSGVVSGERNVGGLVGFDGNGDSTTVSYWSVETSGARYSEGGIGVDTLQTISVAAWGADAWRFGGDRDFPVLVSHDADRQAAGIASGGTRVLNVYGGLTTLDARATTEIYAFIEEGATSGFAVLQLDTNGLAANEGETGETSKPECSLRDGVLSAAVGYNGVTVRVRSENAALSELQSGCKFVLHSLSVLGEATLSVDIVAGAATLRRIYNLSVKGIMLHSAPEIVNSGTTIFIAADAAAGSAAATVIAVAANERVSATFAYAAQSPYFTVSERDEGAVHLSDSALDIFGDEDNKELTLAVTVSNERAPTLLATATLYFRSAPRAIDGGALIVMIEDFRRGATILPSRLVKAKVLHAEESYSIDDGYGLFAANPDDGAISLTEDIFVSGAWTVVLRAAMESGLIAARQTIAFRTPPPLGGDNPFDDGYDENGKGEGTPENPFRIYNIEQLQAIDGAVAPEVAGSPEEARKGIDLFGASDEERLSRHYVLANDIDATATRDWNKGEGFEPIGLYIYHNDPARRGYARKEFRGSLNGNGNVIRGLWINRPIGRSDSYGLGIFGYQNGRVVSVGVVGARIVGEHTAGVLAGYNAGTILRSWSVGSFVSGYGAFGGLVGNHARGLIEESWFSGSVVGGSSSRGGIAGEIWSGRIRNSWASGLVTGYDYYGGFAGFQNGGSIENSWTAAAVIDNMGMEGGGFIGGNVGDTSNSYWSFETAMRNQDSRITRDQMHGESARCKR